MKQSQRKVNLLSLTFQLTSSGITWISSENFATYNCQPFMCFSSSIPNFLQIFFFFLNLINLILCWNEQMMHDLMKLFSLQTLAIISNELKMKWVFMINTDITCKKEKLTLGVAIENKSLDHVTLEFFRSNNFIDDFNFDKAMTK